MTFLTLNENKSVMFLNTVKSQKLIIHIEIKSTILNMTECNRRLM